MVGTFLPIDGLQIADLLQRKGLQIKSKTKTSVTVLVSYDRVQAMGDIADFLKSQKAQIDRSLKGSSIGGIRVGNVKILVKKAGGTGGLDVESQAIDDLTSALLAAIMYTGGPISIKVRGRTVKNITQVLKTAGTPKIDFHLADDNSKPLVHISHKKGSSPRDFQQWGGMTEERIYNHPEVKKFAYDCKMLFGEKIPNGESVYREIKDKNLKMMAVFGVNYDKPSPNENKVDVLLQGDPGLKHISGDVFELTATGHIHYFGDVPAGGFEPVMAMIYKGDRDQFDIKGARASIYPKQGRNFKRKI